jgi:hypothetical protein
VTTSIRRLAGALCLATCCSLPFNISAQTITHVIGDDGYASVPLQFEFPLYGQTFTNSWMYDNGVIGFVDPAQGGYIGLGVQPFSVNMGSVYNYAIYALWSDLINISGSHTTQGTSQFQRYNWIGISPFYDSTRINTFSVEIRPDGRIITNYSLISVDYAGIGITGDVGRGEFEQIGFYQAPLTTGGVSDWERYTAAADPCADSGCAPVLTPGPEFTTTTPRAEIVESAQGVEVTVITPAPLGSGIARTAVLAAISREQTRLLTLERSLVEMSQETASVLGSQTLEILESRRSSDGTTASESSTHESNNTVSVAGFTAVDLLDTGSKSSDNDDARPRGVSGAGQSPENNELAGGISMAALAVQPAGFSAYYSALTDGSFYAPREIYRGQQTVDNVRALRGLGSDRLHQEMVNQQYRR